MKPSHAPQASVSKPVVFAGTATRVVAPLQLESEECAPPLPTRVSGTGEKANAALRAGGGCLPSFKADAMTGCLFFCFFSVLSVLICGSTTVDSPN